MLLALEISIQDRSTTWMMRLRSEMLHNLTNSLRRPALLVINSKEGLKPSKLNPHLGAMRKYAGNRYGQRQELTTVEFSRVTADSLSEIEICRSNSELPAGRTAVQDEVQAKDGTAI